MKKFFFIVIAIVILVGSYLLLGSRTFENEQTPIKADYKNISYMIEGKLIKLDHGIAETEGAPGSETKIITRYFGNEIETDLDGDGLEDIAFIITQNRGGSGTFYYAVAAHNTGNGYIGSDGYLLGDRIAPQSTGINQDPGHIPVVVFNYADRAEHEPMTASPSIGTSVYLKLDPVQMRWDNVTPELESETR